FCLTRLFVRRSLYSLLFFFLLMLLPHPSSTLFPYTTLFRSVTAEEKVDYSDIYDSISQGETVGVLYIPRLEREIPIIEGTDEEELAQGVGHYKDTGYPGENKQILLSGHRDTVFRQFGELEHGDE